MADLTPSELYPRLHTGNPGDVDFYRGICRGTKRVLELGCGWGRVTRPIAEICPVVVGIDRDPQFVEQARKALANYSGATALVGDITAYNEAAIVPSKEKFDRVIVPYNTLYALGGPTGVKACFELARYHLQSDGELWCDVYAMDGFHLAWQSGEPLPEDDDEPVYTFTWQSQALTVLETSKLDPKNQRIEADYRTIDPDGREVVRCSITHDYLLLPELQALLDAAGLQPRALYGSFDGSEYGLDAEHLVFSAIAKKN